MTTITGWTQYATHIYLIMKISAKLFQIPITRVDLQTRQEHHYYYINKGQ